ncbi:hypothetical protein [Novosphingobium sp. ST904]|uniref:hypothetical protein n=1 Tax=Novosphingobium sp. ST904 TaxID=1684385 RepID=UPI0009E93D69|nr:hypothetical protein [Novosphingobium sp. ST904]TCM30036.1 hypothetical protein EDF59_12763 [Novosphingobium sp. ST904]
MSHEPQSLHLTVPEIDRICADVSRIWKGATGLTETPPPDQMAELVGRILRKAREAIAARDCAVRGVMHVPENELPY